MRVLEIRPPFGIDSLAYAERPLLSPGPEQIVLQLRAVSLNYRDWPQRVVDLTNGGADLVVDTAGTLPEAIAAARVGGTVAFIGLLTGAKVEIDLVALMGKSARIQAIDVGSRAMFEAMNRAIAAAALRPVVDRVFGFDQAREAFRYLEGRTHFGKVCVRL